jgi:translation initiation factor IF-2
MRSQSISTTNHVRRAPVPAEVVAENLRRPYEAVLQEDMPDRFHQLLEDLRANGENE